MAGEVKQKYPNNVELEVVYPSQTGNSGNLPGAPNIAVDGEALGNSITLEDLEAAVVKRIRQEGEL